MLSFSLVAEALTGLIYYPPSGENSKFQFIVRSPPIANGSVRQANLTVVMSMERREWFKMRKQNEASFAGKQRTSMSKMNPQLIRQTRNAYFAQRDGLKDKLDQA